MTPVIPNTIAAALMLTACGAFASTTVHAAHAASAADAHAGSAATRLWRCTDTSGRVSYSQQPCPGGGGDGNDHGAAPPSRQPMQFKDERTRAQQRESMDHQSRDLKLARQMRAERLHQERVARVDKPISMSGKGKPHVIRSTPNDHRPVPIVDSTKPVKVKAPKANPGAGVRSNSEMGSATRP